jgi:hypothetical protein
VRVGLETAKRTLHGRKKVRQILDYDAFPSLSGRWYSDTMFSRAQSVRGHVAARGLTNYQGSAHFYLMKSKVMAGPFALMPSIREVDVPQTFLIHNAPKEVHGEFRKICQYFQIKREQSVPYSPWSNLAKSSIGN